MNRSATAALITIAFASFSQTTNAAIVYGTLYEDSASIACNAGSITCELSFAVLPAETAGKNVRITDVSCEFVSSLPVTRARLQISDNGQNYRRDHYLPAPNQDGQFTYRSPVDLLVTGGPPRRVSMTIGTPNSSNILNMYCNIVGRIEPL